MVTTIHAGEADPDVRDACADRLRRNGISPDDVVQVDLLPLRLARIHEYDTDERGCKYTVGEGDDMRVARKRPYLRWLPRR